MAQVTGVRLAGAEAILDAQSLDSVGTVRRQQRIYLIRHVAVIAQTAGRTCLMVRVLQQALAVRVVTLIARLVRLHATCQKEVRVAIVHRMATKTAQLSVAALVARRPRHTLVLDGGGERRAVTPEAAIGLGGIFRRRNRTRHGQAARLSLPGVELHLLGFRPEEL